MVKISDMYTGFVLFGFVSFEYVRATVVNFYNFTDVVNFMVWPDTKQDAALKLTVFIVQAPADPIAT